MSENETITDAKRLYLDESGEISFSPQSYCTHFVITVLSVDPSHVNTIKKRLKREHRKFIRRGWPKHHEFKAFTLHKRFGGGAIERMLTTLASVPSLNVNYVVINKPRINNQSFRAAPYGTAYNYFAGVLLSEMVFKDGLQNVHLIYDLRNKETHEKEHFRQYLETKILGMALEQQLDASITMEGGHSHKHYGLMAVDYFSWSIFRRFERGDSRFFDIFKGILKRKREWYI